MVQGGINKKIMPPAEGKGRKMLDEKGSAFDRQVGGDQNKKIIYLKDKAEAAAFMKFLVHERNRHIEDIMGIDLDLVTLKMKWGLELPDVPTNIRFEV